MRCRLTLAGPLPRTIAATIEERCEVIEIQTDGGSTHLDLALRDQSSLRALMTLLWDVGLEVSSVTTHTPVGEAR